MTEARELIPQSLMTAESKVQLTSAGKSGAASAAASAHPGTRDRAAGSNHGVTDGSR